MVSDIIAGAKELNFYLKNAKFDIDKLLFRWYNQIIKVVCMSLILSFVSPLEFLLRYTVIIGILISSVGVALCLMAKKLSSNNSEEGQSNKQTSVYEKMGTIGFALVLVGMIVMILPFEATLYMVG